MSPPITESDLWWPLSTSFDAREHSEYLDAAYPARKLFRGSASDIATQKEIINALQRVSSFVTPLVATSVPTHLLPDSVQYYRETREKRFGVKLEEVAPAGSEKEAKAKADLKGALDDFAERIGPAEPTNLILYQEDEEKVPRPTYTLFTVAALFAFIDRAGPGGLWDEIASWNEGRWKSIYDSGSPFFN